MKRTLYTLTILLFVQLASAQQRTDTYDALIAREKPEAESADRQQLPHPSHFSTSMYENPIHDQTTIAGGEKGWADSESRFTNMDFDPAQGSYQGAVSATYTSGDIATDFGEPEGNDQSDCPGTLVITLPAGAIIVGVDVHYSMTATGTGWMSDQHSRLVCSSAGGQGESSWIQGVGGDQGTFEYERTGLDIANNVTGGGNVTFQLHAFRTFGGSGDGCATGHNYVDDQSWQVTVHYIMTLPFHDGFEEPVVDASWTQYLLGERQSGWNVTTSHAHNFETSLVYGYSTTISSDSWIVSPAIQTSNQNPGHLSFWYMMRFVTYYTYSGLWISDGSPDPQDGDFVEVFEFDEDMVSLVWQHFALDLDEYTGGQIYIAFVYQGIDGHNFHVDDFRVMHQPQVEKPVFYSELDFNLKLMDQEPPYQSYGYGLKFPNIFRDATWMDGHYYLITGPGILYKTEPETAKIEIMGTVSPAFTNGIAYDHLSDKMYRISTEVFYELNPATAESTLIANFPSGFIASEIAFNNQGELFFVYKESDLLKFGTLDVTTGDYTEILETDLATNTIGGLYYDYTDDVFYFQFNVHATEMVSELYRFDYHNAELVQVESAESNNIRTGIVSPWSQVNFQITDSNTGNPLEGAVVLAGNNEITSNAQGVVQLGLGYGTHNYEVVKDGYFAASGSFELGVSGLELEVSLTQSRTLTVSVFTGANPIPNATVSLDGGDLQQTTNSQGVTTFASLTPEEYDYSVSATGYQPVSGSVDLAGGDKELEVFLELNTYLITAEVFPSGAGSVSGTGEFNHGSQVSLNATANAGFVFASWTENDQEVFTNPGYSFTAGSNRALVANFEQTTSLDEYNETGITLYPNPASNRLHVSLDNYPSRVQVYDLKGTLLLSLEKPEKEFQMDVSSFKQGVYLLRVVNDAGIQSYRFIVTQ